jgi:hypothetical protein
MSGLISSALTTVGNIVEGALNQTARNAINTVAADVASIFFHNRNIGGIIADVTIEEQETHRLMVTQHPVATGTPVSDHAYMMPPTVTIRCGWTNAGSSNINQASSLAQNLVAWAVGSGSRVKGIYTALLDLQKSATPFQLTTGKWTYDNMLITSLSVRTDEKLEYTLMVEAEFQQVLIVNTAGTSQPDQTSQTLATKTAATVDSGGNTQPKPSGPLPSMLSTGYHAVLSWITG